MTSWLQFLLIIPIIAIDDLLHEISVSLMTTYNFLRFRVRWILHEKARTMLKK